MTFWLLTKIRLYIKDGDVSPRILKKKVLRVPKEDMVPTHSGNSLVEKQKWFLRQPLRSH